MIEEETKRLTRDMNRGLVFVIAWTGFGFILATVVYGLIFGFDALL